ncbi:hypothetical protein BP5796_09183 [Coleophoma crateriformis]|uniref:C2H2-type domain-containing protein n=1 Tax=Coleophoma crateriformis TaxID=565419 RepID=A0A3D8R3G4_9HELO|nr:hypothetical protein BP5796_09183 [Coleophoma crateriformis]
MAANPPNGLHACPICDCTHNTGRELRTHKRKAHPRCASCKTNWLGPKQLEQHQKEEDHNYCSECDLCFERIQAHVQHVRTIEHASTCQCCDCGRQYPGQGSLDNHCCDCDRVFRGPQGLQFHFAGHKAHRPRVSVPRLDARQDGAEKTAGDSGRSGAATKKSVKQKKQGKKKGKKKEKATKKNINCPASEQCTKKFARPSALISHLESGRCVSGMTREKLNTMVIDHDQNRLISAEIVEDSSVAVSPTHSPLSLQPNGLFDTSSSSPGGNSPDLIDDGDESDEWSLVDRITSQSLIIADDDCQSEWSVVSSKPPSLDPSEWSFLGSSKTMEFKPDLLPIALRCDLCPVSRPCFSTVKALQAHTSSAAHAPKIFHCPLALLPESKPGTAGKKRFFSTLSALSQHIESGACHGNETFKLVFKFVEEQLDLFGLSGVKLLI